MPDVMGHAKSFFDDTLSDGALNPRRGLIQYRNGSAEKPRPDDLLVFTDTKYGHVGIVTDTGDATVAIIQQNILFHTRQRFSLVVSTDRWLLIADYRSPIMAETSHPVCRAAPFRPRKASPVSHPRPPPWLARIAWPYPGLSPVP